MSYNTVWVFFQECDFISDINSSSFFNSFNGLFDFFGEGFGVHVCTDLINLSVDNSSWFSTGDWCCWDFWDCWDQSFEDLVSNDFVWFNDWDFRLFVVVDDNPDNDFVVVDGIDNDNLSFFDFWVSVKLVKTGNNWSFAEIVINQEFNGQIRQLFSNYIVTVTELGFRDVFSWSLFWGWGLS